jgi:RNA polymerase sigma-70 factor (ECF subfamily)
MVMDVPQRQTWLGQARGGDAAALGALLDSYRGYVGVLVRGVGGWRPAGQADDSDLLQDALREASRGFAGFQGATLEEFTAWLRGIVLRAAGKAQRGPPGTQKPDVGHEGAARMAESLARLPEEMQQVLLSRHVDGLGHADVARQLGRTEGAVRMLYLRALRRLREICQEPS